MSKKDWVEAQIKSDKVVIFSKTYCPFCKKAKQAFTDAGLKNFLVIELDSRDDGSEIQDILLGITGARSVRIYYFTVNQVLMIVLIYQLCINIICNFYIYQM